MAMTITERRIGDVTVLELAGRLVLQEGDILLRERINDIVDQARLKIILDLADVTYIDSSGVGVIAAKYVSLRRKGGDLRLSRLSPRTHHVLDTSGLLNIFQSFDDEAAAVESFHSKAGA